MAHIDQSKPIRPLDKLSYIVKIMECAVATQYAFVHARRLTATADYISDVTLIDNSLFGRYNIKHVASWRIDQTLTLSRWRKSLATKPYRWPLRWRIERAFL
jgi:hypothetical protein